MATIDIEAVVLEVVRRLLPTAAPVVEQSQAASQVNVVSRTEVIVPAAATAAPKAASQATPAPSAPAAALSPLTIFSVPGKVITLKSIEGRLAGVTELKVEPRAIVTPAVNDELRKRGIRLSRSATAAGSAKAVASKLLVANHVSPELSGRSQSLLSGAAITYETLQSAATPKLVDVARELAFRVTSGRQLGLFITNQPAVASSVLQKMVGVRACCLADTAALQEAMATLAPNVVVADARKLDRQSFGSLVGQFVAAGYRDCPPELRGIL